MTRSGIERNLKISPYKTSFNYNSGNTISYFFSSEKIQLNFENLMCDFYFKTHEGLCNRFRMNFYISSEIVDVKLYRQLESRGFYIEVNGIGIDNISKLSYDGRKLNVATEEIKTNQTNEKARCGKS